MSTLAATASRCSCARPRRPGRGAVRGLAPHVAVDAARRGDPVLRACGARRRRSLMAAWVALILAQPGVARRCSRAHGTALRPGPAPHRAGAATGRSARRSAARCGASPPSRCIPASPAHQALLIVCLFGVVLGGLNLTAVYKPSFYGFVLPALVPLIVRVALEADPVHLYTALVMTVVLALRARLRPSRSTTC